MQRAPQVSSCSGDDILFLIERRLIPHVWGEPLVLLWGSLYRCRERSVKCGEMLR